MTCVHKVQWSVKRPEDCRFRLSVSHYKDRIVAPDEYSGVTEVTPSAETQVLATKKKFVQEDITVLPAPTEYLSTDHNGTFTPSEGKVGFYQVDVNVNPDLRPLSVSENGSYQPAGFDGFSGVSVDVLSIMDNLLEIVSSVTPNENKDSLEFPCDKKTGMYIIVSDPPGTREFASQQRLAETLNMVQFDIRGVPGALQSYDAKSICYHKNPSSSNETDWWTAKINLGENSITVNPTSGRYPFLAGVTYYLLRVKGT